MKPDRGYLTGLQQGALSVTVRPNIIQLYLAQRRCYTVRDEKEHGGLAEWLKAFVLKTSEG